MNNLPDFDYDPTGNLDARVKRMEQEQFTSRVTRATAAAEEAFVAENPDYYDALEHIREREISAMMAGGVAEDEARAQLHQHELAAAAEIVSRGGNPAQYAYELAQKRYGYQSQSGSDDEIEALLREIR